uniref:Otopetrin-2 n=1 Tax=Leptobrachium leishanense TaxID=445787 RepID=A0A8C5Q8I0_9ANUR
MNSRTQWTASSCLPFIQVLNGPRRFYSRWTSGLIMAEEKMENLNGTTYLKEAEDPKLDILNESPPTKKEHPADWKNGRRLASGLVAINIILLGSALVSSGAFHEVSVVETEVLSFICVLMCLTGVWMISYLIWTARHKDSEMLKDTHAGPVWLRGGLALFGLCTVVLDILKIGKAVILIHCTTPLKIVHPVIQIVFVVIQTYYLWVSSQDCVQIHKNRTRCGLMFTLGTNLTVWMAAVTEESLHQTVQEEGPLTNETVNGTRSIRAGGSYDCGCVTDLCSSFETGYYYLYPFNIEYCLFASALSYVMWKNVGRIVTDNVRHKLRTFKAQKHLVGLFGGIAVLISGLGVFVVYEIEVNSPETKIHALTMFYIFNIVALSLMTIGALAATVIYRLVKRDMDVHKNPTRTLDVALLVMAALGQFFISYYSIVAVISTAPGETIDTLNLVYSLLMIVQHLLQNGFIVEGLHRKPVRKAHHKHRNSIFSLDKDLKEVYSNPAVTAPIDNNNSGHDLINEPGVIHRGSIASSAVHVPVVADLKTKILKEIVLFLLLSNIIFWIMPAFGARPQFENGLELEFYGYPMWIAIVNIGLPFGIFYRMHAVASLLEVYILS